MNNKIYDTIGLLIIKNDFFRCWRGRQQQHHNSTEDDWKYEEIIVLPRTTEDYFPILLQDEETVGLEVVGYFIKVLA